MTQDYKDTLLRYFTGNINNESENNIPIFDEQIETLNKNIVENINTILATQESATNINVLGKIYNETYSTYLIYGTYLGSNSTHYGYIYLVDDNLEEIQMITEFASGTTMFPIYALNQAEDGNLYGLSYDGTSTTRILLFNNIFASGLITGEYRAVLRNDYIVPYSYNPAQPRQNRIIKSPESATYYLILNETNNSKVGIVKFVINVGSSNEWRNYEIEKTILARFDVKLDKVLGDERLSFYCIDAGSSTVPSNYYEYQLVGDTVTLNKTITLQSRASFTYSQVFVRNENNIYIFACHPTKGVLYKVNGNNVDVIYNFDFVSSGSGYYLSYIDIFQIDNDIFLKKKFTLGNNTYDLSLAYLNQNNQIYWYYVGETGRSLIANTFYDYIDFYPKVTYNLVSLCVPIYGTTNTTKKYTFDFNSLNYNGISYENINSLLPTKCRLYNDDKMIFARNLYNKTIYNNTTLSQIQIPNTLLNDVIISQQDLIGATNKILTANEEEITKNIYETVYLNFYNKLGIQDRNLIPFTNNLIGAERVNKSSSNLLDYNNAKATKYRLNYSDNTTFINYLPPALITSKTVSGGNSLYITDSKGGNIINYSVDGATEQNGTPTPSSPQEIKNISSKNLINTTTAQKGYYYNVNAISTSNNWYIQQVPVKPNTTYYLSGNNKDNTTAQIWLMDGNKNRLSTIGNYKETHEITTSSTTAYIGISIADYEGTADMNTIRLDELPYNIKVKVTGKNIFDITNVTIGRFVDPNTLNIQTTNNAWSTSTNYIPIQSNSTITISAKTPSGGTGQVELTEFNKDYQIITTTVTQGVENPTITKVLNENTKYVWFGFRNDKNMTEIQAEENTEATTYEEYKEKQVLIDLSKENLFDSNNVNKINNAFINPSATSITSSGAGLKLLYIPITGGKTYTINKKIGKTFRVGTCIDTPAIGTLTYQVYERENNNEQEDTYTITTNNDSNYLLLNYYRGANPTEDYTEQEILNSITIYESNNSTPYYELCSNKDKTIKDRLLIDTNGNCSITKYIGERVFNGSENWKLSGTDTFYIEQDGYPSGTHDYLTMSNYYIYSTWDNRTNTDYNTGLYRNGGWSTTRLFIRNKDYTNVNNFKTWLSAHNTVVQYELATPETITLPNTQIPLFEGINHITLVDDLETDTSISYPFPQTAIYTITVNVPSNKTINNIDIISNDENTIYQTIDTSNLENSKTYKITQDCYVE